MSLKILSISFWVLVFSLSGWINCYAQTEPFSVWLQELRAEALVLGIQKQTLDEALVEVKPLVWVIEADRNQPEFKKSLQLYLQGALSKKRIQRGREKLAENRQLLNRIANKYRVQPRFIVALWGIESYYGKHTGKVPVIDALVTLAYDGRRSAYFRQELFNALSIIDKGHISYQGMKGSWAGAMGQVQFMPSSFLNFAVDGNADGRIDLWQTPEDYLSSAANYLAQVGWQERRTWGREVLVPKQLNQQLLGLEKQLPLQDWQNYGVRRLNGQALPKVAISASLIQPEGAQGRSFLVYDNYRALMKWNRAHSFAIAVGMLADRLVQE
jgi:membrane-bound lytic murein transglycosylase B